METTLIIGFVILTIVLWSWAILDIIKSKFKSPIMNIIWLLGVLLLPVLGSILYFQLRKKYVIKEPRKFQPNFNKTELKTTE
ncbi:PLDc N-terminal domain-containing protein [Lacinutrix sp. Bg11-31]|uniref:PLDc N-terminal domain-containing protein n=1 Tax=Lacinutrix sp. Bg11-31 TaxID=2057808 RepID=UPI000C312195|nr:PLDc N-terminal domain-containing protein [Lacinutrix sp. Bg11-31]AUC80723.1 phospholipase [Lacinutrix sp. Bg11-31]